MLGHDTSSRGVVGYPGMGVWRSGRSLVPHRGTGPGPLNYTVLRKTPLKQGSLSNFMIFSKIPENHEKVTFSVIFRKLQKSVKLWCHSGATVVSQWWCHGGGFVPVGPQ